MSTVGKNYRSVPYANGDYTVNQMVTSWQYTCESIKESMKTLRKLLTLGMDIVRCINILYQYTDVYVRRITSNEIDEFILALYTG